jgi:hypothetical protein
MGPQGAHVNGSFARLCSKEVRRLAAKPAPSTGVLVAAIFGDRYFNLLAHRCSGGTVAGPFRSRGYFNAVAVVMPTWSGR